MIELFVDFDSFIISGYIIVAFYCWGHKATFSILQAKAFVSPTYNKNCLTKVLFLAVTNKMHWIYKPITWSLPYQQSYLEILRGFSQPMGKFPPCWSILASFSMLGPGCIAVSPTLARTAKTTVLRQAD